MKSLPPILASVAIVLLMLAIYAVAYFALGEFIIALDDPIEGSVIVQSFEREFSHGWMVPLFSPAALVESWSEGQEVRPVYCPADDLEEE